MKADLADRAQFRILGPVEVRSGQHWQGVDDMNWRSLLSCLLLRPGELVPLESLVSALWGNDPPDRASNLVSIYVHRLRGLIGDPRGRVLAHRASAYQLCIGLGDLDLLQFEALVEAGRSAFTTGNPGTASVLLTEALMLWRGPALADVRPTAFLTAQAGRLAELRVTAVELRAAADLACGRAGQLIPGLRQLVADNPSREGPRLLLTRAVEEAARNAAARNTRAFFRQVAASAPGTEARRIRTRPPGWRAPEAVVGTGRSPRQASWDLAAVPGCAHAAPGPNRAAAEPACPGPDAAATREDFARALDAARTWAGLTVHEAAWAGGISPGEAAGYFTGNVLPHLSEGGLRTLHGILAACGITDPEQFNTWTYALARSSPVPDPRPRPAGHDSEKAAGQARPGPTRTMPDLDEFDLCPAPHDAQTAADLLAALSRFRIWAGEPSFQEMQRLSEPRTAASTMCTALGRSSLPSLRVIRAIVTGCGGTSEQLQAFTTAWRRIRLSPGQPGTQPEPSVNRPLYPVRGTGTLQPDAAGGGPLSPGGRNPRRRPA